MKPAYLFFLDPDAPPASDPSPMDLLRFSDPGRTEISAGMVYRDNFRSCLEDTHKVSSDVRRQIRMRQHDVINNHAHRSRTIAAAVCGPCAPPEVLATSMQNPTLFLCLNRGKSIAELSSSPKRRLFPCHACPSTSHCHAASPHLRASIPSHASLNLKEKQSPPDPPKASCRQSSDTQALLPTKP